MRYLAEYTLSNGYNLSVLIDGVQNMDSAKSCAYINSQCLPDEYKIKRTDTCKIERWNPKSQGSANVGGHQYGYFIVINKQIADKGKLNAAGIKSAFNMIVNQIGPEAARVVYLADMQKQQQIMVNKKSSVAEAKNTLGNPEKRKKCWGRAIEKSRAAKDSRLVMEVGLLTSMVEDYCSGDYRDIPIGTIVGVTAAILYFVSPIDLVPDVFPGVGQLDDVAVIGLAVKLSHDDLLQYEEWRKNT